MNRPIVIILIGYIIGIIWGLYLKISIVFLYVFLIIIYKIINKKYKKKEFKILSIKRYFRYIKLVFKIDVILVIIISSLISNLIVKQQNQKYENVYKNIKEIEITGKIISNKIEKEYSNRYKIKVINGKYKNTRLYIDVNKKTEIEFGDTVILAGEFKEPQTASNYKGFNYKKYLKTIKIYGTIKVENIKIIKKDISISKVLNNLSLQIKDNIDKTYNENAQGIIKGVLIGDTTDIDEETKEQFSESNISHVLAVSGMHISYIIFLITKSTQRVFGKRKSKIISSIILIIYMVVTGFSTSVVRASIMGILVCLSFVFFRKSNTLNNIAISALIILINNSFSILSLSFLLTYGGTLGIILFKNNIEKMLKNIKIRHRKWKYLFLKIQRKFAFIIEMISTTISAQIMILPIILLNFNNMGIAFLITNLLLNFVIGLIIMGGIIQILISFISLDFAILIAKIIELPINILIFISKIGGKIPLGNFKVITPEFYQIIIYYIFIFVSSYLYQIFHKKDLNVTEKRIKNTISLLKYKLKPFKQKLKYIIIILFIMIFTVQFIPHELEINFIDVGQGDSSLIITPQNKTILIDGGGSEKYDIGNNTLIPYLLNRKITQIDYMMISHFDTDHCRTDLLLLWKS